MNILVHRAAALPLPVDLAAAPKREARQPLVVTKVAEHRFDRGGTRADHALAGVRIDLRLHPVGMALRSVSLEKSGHVLKYNIAQLL